MASSDRKLIDPKLDGVPGFLSFTVKNLCMIFFRHSSSHFPETPKHDNEILVATGMGDHLGSQKILQDSQPAQQPSNAASHCFHQGRPPGLSFGSSICFHNLCLAIPEKMHQLNRILWKGGGQKSSAFVTYFPGGLRKKQQAQWKQLHLQTKNHETKCQKTCTYLKVATLQLPTKPYLPLGCWAKLGRLPLEASLPSRWTSWEFAIQRNRTTDCRGQVHLGQWQNSCDWKMSVAEQLRVWFRMMGLHIEILQVSHFVEDISPFRKVDSARQNHTLRIISCLPIQHFLGYIYPNQKETANQTSLGILLSFICFPGKTSRCFTPTPLCWGWGDGNLP